MDNQKKNNKELENESARINNVSETKFTPSALKILSKKSHILILAAIVIVVLVTGGYFYYSYSAGQLRADKENELKAIAELKTEQLVGWHKERIADTKVISESPFFVKGIEEWLGHKNRKPLSADILEILNSAKTNIGYEDIFLVSAKGELLLSVESKLESVGVATTEKIIEASGSGKITFTGLYFCPLHNKIHYDIIAPIKNNSNRIIADLIFRVDPYEYLYPLIQSWPTPSKTAEVLLIKKDGDSVLYLNELRHKKNTAVQLRIPLTSTDLPATQAILGKTGIFDGKDYRGTDVVAWLSPVPGTDWFMVSKVDKVEIFAGLNFIASIVFIVIVLLILALSIGMVWVYHYRQRNVFRNLWQVQEEFRATLYSIGDGVISTDINGFIVNMNPIAETLCGWELKDALGKPLTEVFKIINSDTRKVVVNPVNLVLKNGEIVGLANHTVLISKNGTEYQIADSAAPIKNKDGEISGVVLVFSDVTQKYAADKAIRDSEEFLKETQIIAQLGTYTLDINTGIWTSSEILDQIFGIEKNHDKSMDGLVSIIHPDWQKTMNDYFIEEVTGKKLKFDKEYQIIRKANNEIRWVHDIGKLEFDEQGNPVRMLGTIQDITERKQAEAKIASLSNIVEHSLNEIYVFDATTLKFAFVNDGALNNMGYTLEEIQHLTPVDIKPEYTQETFLQAIKPLLTGEAGILNFETIHKRKNGSVYPVEIHLQLSVFEDKQLFAAIILDITERKRAEENIKTLTSALELSPLSFVITNSNGEIEYTNKQFTALTRYSFADVEGKKPRIFNKGKLDVGPFNEMQHLLKEGKSWTGEFYNRKKDGSSYWEEVIISALTDENGQITHYVLISEDITQLRETRLQLKLLSHSVEQSPVSVMITDKDRYITYVNPTFEQTSGYSLDELKGQTPSIIQSGENPREVYTELLNTILSGKTWQGEFRNKRKNGELYWDRSVISPITNSKNEITHFVALQQDITREKAVLAELVAAKEKAQESDKLKSAFLANMSHEIRTPMNGILGFADLLKEPELTGEQQQKYIAIIEKSGARMLNIINDIVDISKIEAGLMTLDIKESDINEQIEYIYTFFKPEAEAKGMNLLVKTSLPSKEAIIKTDREKVFAILTNLVKNAIKYSEKGVIELGYIKNGETLQFYVKDTGIGIPKDRQEAIFERFIQADITDKMARQGAGLGLSITKAYVEMLGGKIWVESQEGVGSTFYFTLACNAEPKEKKIVGNSVTLQEEKVEINPEVSGLKILIAEDDETSEMLISINVKEFSKEILIARNGFEAVEICRNNPDTDLILMDIQMPVMSGYEATRQIRQFNKDVVIIAQTAFALSAERDKAIEAGCNDYIAKPINNKELYSLIQKYFKK